MAEITDRDTAIRYAEDRGWTVETTQLVQQGLTLWTDRWTKPGRPELVLGVWAGYRDMPRLDYWVFGVVEAPDRQQRIEALWSKDDASLEKALDSKLT